jgi:hypothetical protein
MIIFYKEDNNMFREIRVKEIRIDKKEEEKGYMKIKPETNISVKEANEMVMQIWQDMIKQANQEG